MKPKQQVWVVKIKELFAIEETGKCTWFTKLGRFAMDEPLRTWPNREAAEAFAKEQKWEVV